MKTKEEVIKEAWGRNYEEFKEYIDENGWGLYPHFQKHEMIENVRPLEFKENGLGFRPKSLSGIENNNGWVRIESINGLPKEPMFCYYIRKSDNGTSMGVIDETDFDRITHYQPIIKPKPPIY